MIVPLRQHERRPAVAHGLDDVVADAAIARLVVDQLLIERLELDALVRIGDSCVGWNAVGCTSTNARTGAPPPAPRAFTRCRTGPHCMKMIGWWPSLRATVADKPRTNRALAWRATCSKLCADR